MSVSVARMGYVYRTCGIPWRWWQYTLAGSANVCTGNRKQLWSDWCMLGRQPTGRVLTTWRSVARQGTRQATNNDPMSPGSRGWRAVSRRCANRCKRQYLGALCCEGKGRPWIRKTGHLRLGKCGECGACLPCLKPRDQARLTGHAHLVHGWRRAWSRQQFGGYAGSLAARVKVHNVHSQQLGEDAGKPSWARTGAKLQSVSLLIEAPTTTKPLQSPIANRHVITMLSRYGDW